MNVDDTEVLPYHGGRVLAFLHYTVCTRSATDAGSLTLCLLALYSLLNHNSQSEIAQLLAASATSKGTKLALRPPEAHGKTDDAE